MIDKQKRNTLKKLSAATLATATVGASAAALADSASSLNQAASGYNEDIAQIDVYTRVSSSTNDVEVVIQNSGSQSARITQMTPSQTVTRRGTFEFAPLLKNGDLQLAAGQRVTVPMTPRAVVLDASSSAAQRAESLSDALRKSFSVVTENEAFAYVRVADTVRFA